MTPFDEALLDDPARLAEADPRGVLRTLAAAGAQVRRTAWTVAETPLSRVGTADRPRLFAVAAPAAYGPLTQALTVLAGPTAPAPVVGVCGTTVPGWLGPLDLLVVVGRTGTEADQTTLVEQVWRRGCALVVIAPPDSPLDRAAEQARAIRLPVDALAEPIPGTGAGDRPGAAFWPLFTALLATARAYGLLTAETFDADALADRADEVCAQLRPTADTYLNPAKSLAVDLAGSIPLLWGADPLAAVAAERFAQDLTAVAGLPAQHGVLPSAAAASGALLDGPFTRSADGSDNGDDFFRDRTDDEGTVRITPVIMATDDSRPVQLLAGAVQHTTERTGHPARLLAVPPGEPLQRLAHLLVLSDFTAAYLALGHGLAPTGQGPFSESAQTGVYGAGGR